MQVILDVVYNHTNEADDANPYTTSFRGIDNKVILRGFYGILCKTLVPCCVAIFILPYYVCIMYIYLNRLWFNFH